MQNRLAHTDEGITYGDWCNLGECLQAYYPVFSARSCKNVKVFQASLGSSLIGKAFWDLGTRSEMDRTGESYMPGYDLRTLVRSFLLRCQLTLYRLLH
jgi:hypothetical protein